MNSRHPGPRVFGDLGEEEGFGDVPTTGMCLRIRMIIPAKHLRLELCLSFSLRGFGLGWS